MCKYFRIVYCEEINETAGEWQRMLLEAMMVKTKHSNTQWIAITELIELTTLSATTQASQWNGTRAIERDAQHLTDSSIKFYRLNLFDLASFIFQNEWLF